MEVMRCQSMGDSNPRLARLFREKLSEVQNYLRWDATQRLRLSRRSESKAGASSSAGGRSLWSNAVGSVKNFFTPKPRTSVLEEHGNPSVVDDVGGAVRGRARESNGISRADSSEEKASIQIGDTGPEEPTRGAGLSGSAEPDVIQSAQQDGSAGEGTVADVLASSALEQEEKSGEKMDSKKRAAAAARREDERLKRRRIESRRNEVLLTYPYDGSDMVGRISVTLGDVDRLAPGEFLNDNIIDFYLRRRRQALSDVHSDDKHNVVDLVDGDGAEVERDDNVSSNSGMIEEEIEEEELKSCQDDRLANPPCLLFLDSLRCHRKKKFTKMLRNYLECEWKARFASSTDVSVPKQEIANDADAVEETVVTSFDSDGIGLLEPNVSCSLYG
ncbi:unnamed protein product [Phytophthora fragariaefolia]|uniref:Unnamed protein product n=1 Tax=Phytophthora fragariaefolia TaxID=1490495 RepID=A0A9W6U5A6_9STRA|nr:unnamed protein product [Phytophthora fragariaefolia]